MSSAKDEQAPKLSRIDAERAAAVVLLTAIAESVQDAKAAGSGPNGKLDQLKKLAEAYALVVHGKVS